MGTIRKILFFFSFFFFVQIRITEVDELDNEWSERSSFYSGDIETYIHINSLTPLMPHPNASDAQCYE